MRALLVAVLVTLAACAAPKSERCQDICEREAKCAENIRGTAFDQNECEAACAVLERNAATRESVAEHEACLDEAATCEQVLACR